MLTSWHLREKSREVRVKARLPQASIVVIGQVTKHTTVKWPNLFQICLQNCHSRNKVGMFTITNQIFSVPTSCLRLGSDNLFKRPNKT